MTYCIRSTGKRILRLIDQPVVSPHHRAQGVGGWHSPGVRKSHSNGKPKNCNKKTLGKYSQIYTTLLGPTPPGDPHLPAHTFGVRASPPIIMSFLIWAPIRCWFNLHTTIKYCFSLPNWIVFSEAISQFSVEHYAQLNVHIAASSQPILYYEILKFIRAFALFAKIFCSLWEFVIHS